MHGIGEGGIASRCLQEITDGRLCNGYAMLCKPLLGLLRQSFHAHGLYCSICDEAAGSFSAWAWWHLEDCVVYGIAVLVGISYICAPPLLVYQLNGYRFAVLLDTVKKLQRQGPASSATRSQPPCVFTPPGAMPLQHLQRGAVQWQKQAVGMEQGS